MERDLNCSFLYPISNNSRYLGSKILNVGSSVGKYLIPPPNNGNSTIIISGI